MDDFEAFRWDRRDQDDDEELLEGIGLNIREPRHLWDLIGASMHDARVWKNSSAREIMKQQNVFSIAVDSAYPISPTLLKPFSRMEAATPQHRRFNKMLSGLRTVCTVIGI